MWNAKDLGDPITQSPNFTSFYRLTFSFAWIPLRMGSHYSFKSAYFTIEHPWLLKSFVLDSEIWPILPLIAPKIFEDSHVLPRFSIRAKCPQALQPFLMTQFPDRRLSKPSGSLACQCPMDNVAVGMESNASVEIRPKGALLCWVAHYTSRNETQDGITFLSNATPIPKVTVFIPSEHTVNSSPFFHRDYYLCHSATVLFFF